MTGEKLKEFMRRLNAEGYQFELDNNGTGTIFRRGREAAIITGEDEIRYKPENRQLAYHIRDMRDEVNEYMTAYQNAAPGENGFRTLILYAGTELAAKQRTHDGLEFATWTIAREHRDAGHYYYDYAAAKQDFATRAGLVDKNKMFTETELTVIRSNLSDFLQIDGGEHLSDSREDAIKNVIRKIDTVVAPEVEKQQDRETIPEDEPEWEP